MTARFYRTEGHMSGECLCGAFAKPGELDEIRFWYPAMADELGLKEERHIVAWQNAQAIGQSRYVTDWKPT